MGSFLDYGSIVATGGLDNVPYGLTPLSSQANYSMGLRDPLGPRGDNPDSLIFSLFYEGSGDLIGVGR